MSHSSFEILELALKSGASHAEIYQSCALSRPVFFESNRLKQLESSESEGIALRLWRSGCPGLAVAYGPVEAQALVDKAMAISQLNEPELLTWVEPRSDIHQNFGQSMAVETLIDMGKTAIATLRQAYPEVICSSEWQCETETTALINSEGLHCEYQDTSTSYYLGVEWIRGEDFLGIYDGECSQETLNPDQTIRHLLQRLAWASESAKPPTGRMPILFTANAAALLWGTVAAATNGKQVLQQASPWSDQLNNRVISEQITLTQQPQRQPYRCPFDDEGTPTQPLTLIEQGQLSRFYTDRVTARELKINSTGNGFRAGLGAYPTPSLVNFMVKPGSLSWDGLLKQLGNGIIVDQVLGGSPDITGDFSLNIDLGFVVREGEIVGRVKDTMVAGNVYQALKQVMALGNDARWSGSCHTPSLIVDGLSVVG